MRKCLRGGTKRAAAGGGRRRGGAGRGEILDSNKGPIEVHSWALQGTNWAYNCAYNVVLTWYTTWYFFCRADNVVYPVFC